MNSIKYFVQFIFIIFLFSIFKILRLKISSFISGKLFEIIGPIFRSKKIINSNIKKAFPNITDKEIKKITSRMWNSYGRIFAEYVFLKNFRNNYFNEFISIKGKHILNEIKNNKKPVIFISGHFSNFELMAMAIEKMGIKVAAIYRPLNNRFLNTIMERVRKKYICKYQIKKGVAGLKEIIKLNKQGFSTALMIDQRVTQGIKTNFFNHQAFTTTIPSQLVRKYGYLVVPIYIERVANIYFKITVQKPIKFPSNATTNEITLNLNHILEKMIVIKPDQWIWSHNRWKL